jgi:hypothetical protein
MVLDAIVTLGSMLISPVYDFVKKKFLKPNQDTPEATMSTLATTKPEVMPQYVEAMAKLIDAKVRFYNRDVIGQVSKWVSDLRASIRPGFIIVSLVYLFVSKHCGWTIDPFFRYLMESAIGSWFGDRLKRN